MKKFLVALFLIMVSAPMYADVIYPMSAVEYKKIREQRQERYKIRQRQSYINNICGLNEAFDIQSINKCKAELKKEYDATIKLVEKIAKENKKNAKQKAASSD